MKHIRRVFKAAMFFVFLSGLSNCDSPSYISGGIQYTYPPWGPPFYSGVRYYYLPDIEMYYDLSNRDFVYLNDGQWLFSGALPPLYSGYDLYNGFVVVLNFDVYQPWMHHQYYVSHYPRYYYHNVYHGAEFINIHGFNENERKPFYWNQHERDRINDLRKNEKMGRTPGVTRPPQNPNYYGRDIGRPVKVNSNMKENKSGRRSK